MNRRKFDEWLSKFRPSISSYDYYIDFKKVIKNVEEIKVELNILNSLIGSKDIEKEFEGKFKDAGITYFYRNSDEVSGNIAMYTIASGSKRI